MHRNGLAFGENEQLSGPLPYCCIGPVIDKQAFC